MKCRIRYRPTIWEAFDAPNPAPWRVDFPASLRIFLSQRPWVATDYQTFDEALQAFKLVLRAVRASLRGPRRDSTDSVK